MIASLSLTGVHKASAPSVPLSAVVADPGSPGRYAVFVASEEGGKWVAHLREVTLGETHESDVAVDGRKARGEDRRRWSRRFEGRRFGTGSSIEV